MSFGRAFDAFVGGLESGLKSGSDMQDKQLARRPAKEADELNRNVPFNNPNPDVQGLGQLRGRLQTNTGADEAIPTAPSTPDEERGYAQGGVVEDSVDQDNGSYYRQEAARRPQPTAPVSAPQQGQPAPQGPPAPQTAPAVAPQKAIPDQAEDGTPTPFPRPSPGQAIDNDKDGNIITKTIDWVQSLPAGNGAIPDGQAPQQGQPAHPIQTMVDPTGRSYPDLTQTIGGIRAVTGAPANRPLSTADHIDFLQRRMQYAASHGFDMNEAMKFNVQYLDNLRFQASRTFALASAAWDAGDGKAVQKFVQQGYGFVPDGLSAQTSFNNGALTVQAIDEKTGKAVGQPVTMTKDQFMQKAGGITRDPISYGRAIENVPYTAGTTRGAGRAGGGRRGRYASSGEGTGTGATADASGGGATAKPMPTTWGNQMRQSLGGKNADPAHVQIGEKLYTQLPPDQRSPANAAALAQQIAKGERKVKPDGTVTDADGQPTGLKLNLGNVKPVIAGQGNKVAEANAPAPAAAPTAAVTPDAPQITKNGPAATSAPAPAKPAPGTAAAQPTEAIPTDAPPAAPQRSMGEKVIGMGKEVGNVVKDKLGMRPEPGADDEPIGKKIGSAIKDKLGINAPRPSTEAPEMKDNSGDTMVRVSAMEKKLENARSAGAPDATLKIMQAQIDRERAKLK